MGRVDSLTSLDRIISWNEFRKKVSEQWLKLCCLVEEQSPGR
jgi:hypothetical protein